MKRRLWVVGFAGLLVLLILAALSLPWWWGKALEVGGRKFGATFAGYERLGYRRYAIRDVTLQRPGVTIRVTRIEMDTPLLWAWRHFSRTPTDVLAGDWTVDVQKHSSTPHGPSGWVPLRRTLFKVDAALDRWLPAAVTGAGVVRWPGGEIAVNAARWRRDELRVDALRFRRLLANATLTFSAADDQLKLNADSAPLGMAVDLLSHGSAITGTMTSAGQKARITSGFASEGWLPPTAGIDAPELRLTGEQLKLGGSYALVHGRAYVGWQSDHVVADVALRGDPVPGKSVPPINVVMRGRGDARTFTIEALDATLPGVIAALSAPVTIERTGRLRESSARFAVRADLAQQPWLHGRGVVTGEARVVPGANRAPAVDFNVTASDFAFAGIAMTRGEASGTLGWPHLSIAKLEVVAADGERLHGRGDWDFHAKAIGDAEIAGAIRRDTVAQWLPATLQFGRATVDVRVSGPISSLKHAGAIDATAVQYGKLNPADIHATWHGEARRIDAFKVAADLPAAQVVATGAATESEIRLASLRYASGKTLRLQLTQPARIAWKPALAIEQVRLAGPEGTLDADLRLGSAGKVELAVRNFPSTWVSEVVRLPGPEWLVQSFALTGDWDHGAMKYSSAGGVAIRLGEGRTAIINLSARGDADGVAIDALHGVESGHEVVNASGQLPLIIAPASRPIATLNTGGKLVLDATTVPNAAFWHQLGQLTGVELRDPEANVHLRGTWMHPRGEVTLTASRVAVDQSRFTRPLPSIDSIDIALTGDLAGVSLDRFAFSVEGQDVRASGRLPVAKNGWGELIHSPVAFLRRGADLRIEVPDAQVAMFSRFLPTALAPTGRLQADVQYRRGQLGGYLRIRGAASRPLGPLGVLQQVDADVEFSDDQVNLRRVTAMTGGEPVVVSGTVRLPTAGWLGSGATEPRYDLVVRGKNLPFVRQAGLLVRGDLDLKLQSPSKGPPQISGKVALRDSLFLSDVRAFLPKGGASSPARRPPYFSVDTPPLNTWTLDVDVSGDRFLRLRMPVFAGEASAHFHLGGTLGAPRAVGSAMVDEGQVLMPFASFTVTEGAVRLTEEDPYEPTIFLRGTGRHYGYDLTLEITGKASTPDITFRSTPALDPDQVLLMVMTGAAPSNEVNTSITHRALQIGAFVGHSFLGSITGAGAQPDRLSIESGEKISRQGNETYAIEYKLNDRWSLTGEYDEFDEYNVGFKWRVAPKKVKK